MSETITKIHNALKLGAYIIDDNGIIVGEVRIPKKIIQLLIGGTK